MCLYIFLTLFDSSSHLSIKDLKRSPEMEYLSLQVKRKVRFLRGTEAIDIFKSLLFLEVPSDSILSQHLLQMISKNVNRLTTAEIIFLQFLLHKCASNPLVDALKLALPIIFETNVRFQLNREDPETISLALRFMANELNTSDETYGTYGPTYFRNILKNFRKRNLKEVLIVEES